MVVVVVVVHVKPSMAGYEVVHGHTRFENLGNNKFYG
jgi:hypothetical protein